MWWDGSCQAFAAFSMFFICWAGFLFLLKTALPATKVSAPAFVMIGIVDGSMPPSTCSLL